MKFSRKFFGSLQVHTGYLILSTKKNCWNIGTRNKLKHWYKEQTMQIKWGKHLS